VNFRHLGTWFGRQQAERLTDVGVSLGDGGNAEQPAFDR